MNNRERTVLAVFFLICYGTAAIAAAITRPEIAVWYTALAKPSWRPPNFLFGPVWTILYGMIAIAGWRVWCAAASRWRSLGQAVFALQLVFNFLWSPVFFKFHQIGLGALVIAGLWGSIAFFIIVTLRFDKKAAMLFVPYLLWVTFAAALNYTIWTMNSTTVSTPGREYVAQALHLTEALDTDGFPVSRTWDASPVLRFDHDWKGLARDAARRTEVRLLWTEESLFVHIRAKYRTLTLFSDSRADGWRDQLWDRDVAEVFLQPAGSDPLRYLEFEVSPNGLWIDLRIAPGEKENLRSGMRRKVSTDSRCKTWTAQLDLPMKSLTSEFDCKKAWRANFYRIEGEREPRFYAAWSPTFSEKPNFHVPATFGTLLFR